MVNANAAVESSLQTYCQFPHAPKYAVLLQGPWGSGKTHFIKNFFANLENANGDRIPHLYVSLYGMTTTKQIEEAFFRELHPVLSSKPMRLMGTVGKALAKGVLKIDFNRDGIDDGSINPQLPEINLPEYLSRVGERILVFDDLERSQIQIGEALGFINYFVEHDEYKAVIVANESELIKKWGEVYYNTKEKLIGKTLQIKPDYNSASSEFFAKIDNQAVRHFYNEQSAVIKWLFEQSQTQNLRLLQQTLWDFERLANELDPKQISKKDGLLSLLKIFFALAMEFRSGRLNKEQIATIQSDALKSLMARSKDSSDPQPDRLQDRYPEVNFNDTYIEPTLFAEIFATGVVDGDRVRNSLDRHPAFAPAENEPAWKVLWNHHSRTEEQVAAAMKRMEEQFKNHSFLLEGELFHVIGLRLWLARIEAIQLSVDQVKAELKAYIDGHFKSESVRRTPSGTFDLATATQSWQSLGFYEQDTSAFKEIVEYYKSCKADAIVRSDPVLAEEIFAEIDKNTDLFLKKLCLTNNAENHYFDVPLLVHIKPERFADKLLSLPKDRQHTAYMVFAIRYKHMEITPALWPELRWLNTLAFFLKEKASNMSAIGRNGIETWINHYIDPAISEAVANGTVLEEEYYACKK